ncbi:MAG TPA: hypothetical protein VFU50_04170 [Terriglobales bacterium]|nr:hypothetical protein [Terriglobales bacterium]
MGKLIEFYIPEGFSFETKGGDTPRNSRVIEFPSGKSDTLHQITWIFPEVDADLA